MKNKKILYKAILIIIAMILLFSLPIFYSRNKGIKSSSGNYKNNTVVIDKAYLNKVEELNNKVEEYYLTAFDKETFYSQYSYMMKGNGTEATIQDVQEFLEYEVPKEFSNTTIHFVKPKSLKEYKKLKISDQDLEVLTVYTAIPLKNGDVFISSKYDKGGTLKKSEYKDFVLKNSPIFGEIKNPKPNSKEYQDIKQVISDNNPELKDGNIKYLAANDKYATIVTSNKEDPSMIKQFLLEKNSKNKWEVVMSELERNPKYKIFINTSFPNFDLSMLPKYNLAEFPVTSDLSNIINEFKEQGAIDDKDVTTYSCATGKFGYMEFQSGEKILTYFNNDGKFDIYNVDSSASALQKMVELDKTNPPTFIINFEN